MSAASRSRTSSHSSRLVLLIVCARSPSRCAAAIWLRISASSGLTISVGPAPASRSSAVATKYTADFPHPVRCTHNTRARSTTTSRIASSCPGRNRDRSSPVSVRRRSSAVAANVSEVVVGTRHRRTRTGRPLAPAADESAQTRRRAPLGRRDPPVPNPDDGSLHRRPTRLACLLLPRESDGRRQRVAGRSPLLHRRRCDRPLRDRRDDRSRGMRSSHGWRGSADAAPLSLGDCDSAPSLLNPRF